MTNLNLDVARQKALESPNIGKRGKSKKTLQRQEAFKILEVYFFEAFDPIIKKQIKMAKSGDHKAFKELMDRIFGRPRERSAIDVQLPIPLFDILRYKADQGDENIVNDV